MNQLSLVSLYMHSQPWTGDILLLYFFLLLDHPSDPPTLALPDIHLPQEQPLSINHTLSAGGTFNTTCSKQPIMSLNLFSPVVGKDFPWFPFSFPTEMRKQFSLTFWKQTTDSKTMTQDTDRYMRATVNILWDCLVCDCPISHGPKAMRT